MHTLYSLTWVACGCRPFATLEASSTSASRGVPFRLFEPCEFVTQLGAAEGCLVTLRVLNAPYGFRVEVAPAPGPSYRVLDGRPAGQSGQVRFRQRFNRPQGLGCDPELRGWLGKAYPDGPPPLGFVGLVLNRTTGSVAVWGQEVPSSGEEIWVRVTVDEADGWTATKLAAAPSQNEIDTAEAIPVVAENDYDVAPHEAEASSSPRSGAVLWTETKRNKRTPKARSRRRRRKQHPRRVW